MSPARSRTAQLGPLLLLLCSVGSGCSGLGIDPAVLGDLLPARAKGGARLGENEIIAGLKEALRIGAERSVAITSAEGGFLDNAVRRIALPDELEGASRAARAVGLGSQVDSLEFTMNRAAEQASGQAMEVFWDAVGKMTIEDAYGILNGGDDAATRYFRRSTEASLRARFEPIVSRAMQRVGVYQAYEGLVSRYSALGLLGDPRAALDDHVTDGTLDGLFSVLAAEEKRIRTDPAARTTQLLRRVFAR